MGQQAACRLQQRSHFRSGVDVGRRAAREASQEPGGGDFSRRVGDRAVSRELSHRRKPACGLRRIARPRGLRPLDGEFNRQGSAVTDPVYVAGEVPQQPFRRFEAEAESAACDQVIVDQAVEAGRCHRSTSGQGSATSRSFGRSSLA